MLKSIIPFICASSMVLFFQNCQVRPDTHSEPTPARITDPSFSYEISYFEHLLGERTDQVPIVFADLKERFPDKSYAGVCYRSWWNDSLTGAYVEIDKEYWGQASKLQRLNLIFHELGHCYLHRDHVPSDSVMYCPTSFMHDTIMSNYCLQLNWDSYVKEMFGE